MTRRPIGGSIPSNVLTPGALLEFDLGMAADAPVAAAPTESDNFLFFMEMKTTTPPSDLVCARTGANAFVARGLSSGVFVAAATPLYEDRGGLEGGGYWTFPGFTNDMNATAQVFDFSSGAGWTYGGAPSPVFTANDAIAPDGVDLADKLRDGNASAFCDIAKTGLVSTTAMYSLWVQDVAGDAPTAPGCLTQDTGAAVGVSFPVGTAWRRVSFRPTVSGNAFTIWPAGQQPGVAANSHTGAIRVWGASRVRVVNKVDVPLVDGTSGDCILTLGAPARAQVIDSNGDLDIEFAYVPGMGLQSDYGAGTAHYVFHMIENGVETSLRFDQTNVRWIFKQHGVDRILTDQFSITRGGPTNQAPREGDEVRFRIWDMPSLQGTLGLRASGIRMWVNGSCGLDERGNSSTIAYLTPTAVTLGSNGTPTVNMGMRWTTFGRRKVHTAELSADSPVQGVLIGDSTTATRGDQMSPAVGMRTVPNARTRSPIGVMATGGDTWAGELTKWDAATCTWRGMASVGWAIAGLGVNEIAAGVLTIAQIIANAQAMVDRLKVTNPGIKVLVRAMCPAKLYLDGINVAFHPNVFVPVQDALLGNATAGNAFTIVTGVDGRVSAHLAALDPSSTGTMIAAKQIGDNLHPNNSGRQDIANADVAALLLLGITP